MKTVERYIRNKKTPTLKRTRMCKVREKTTQMNREKNNS